MAQVRVKGYVVGYDEVGGELLWKVRVKDSGSVHNSTKFMVHSLHPGTMLSKPSVDVTFMVAPVQVGEEQVMKAVDVAIGEVPSTIVHANTEPASNDASMNFVATELNGEVSLWYTGLESAKEVQADVKHSEERFITFFQIPLHAPSDAHSQYADEFENSMAILHGLLCNDAIREAFEDLLTQVFVHGQNSTQNS